MPPSWPSPSVQGRREWRRPVTRGLSERGSRSPSRWDQGDNGLLLRRPMEAGWSRARALPQDGPRRGNPGRFPAPRLPPRWGCEATQRCCGPRARPVEPEVAPSPGRGGGCCSRPTGRHREWVTPGGSGLRAAGQWLGWWQQEPRQAGPSLGAGATENHNNYKIKPFPLCGKTNNKNSTK